MKNSCWLYYESGPTNGPILPAVLRVFCQKYIKVKSHSNFFSQGGEFTENPLKRKTTRFTIISHFSRFLLENLLIKFNSFLLVQDPARGGLVVATAGNVVTMFCVSCFCCQRPFSRQLLFPVKHQPATFQLENELEKDFRNQRRPSIALGRDRTPKKDENCCNDYT